MALTVAGLATWLRTFAKEVAEHEEQLTALDAAIGDGDHGTNMVRGMRAVVAVLDEQSFGTLDELARKAGMSLVSSVGGASGPLYGTFWLRAAKEWAGLAEADVAEVGQALRAGVDGIRQRGKAEEGDKTMVDALAPAARAYDAMVGEGAGLAATLERAAAAAQAGCEATIPLVARRGRASYLGERSAGHQDPGATSAALMLRSAAAGQA